MGVKVGVIGVGYLGAHHARIYSELDDAELIGVADADTSRAEEIGGKFHCRAYRYYEDLIPRADALSIVTPTTTHHDIALRCILAGKDVLVEKPLTTTLAEADDLLREAALRDRVLQVGHLERFNPVVAASEGLIKNPRFFESERLSPFLGRGTDVDVTLDLMIHDIDIILSLCHGTVRDIKAVGAPVLTDRIDVSKAWLEMDNGVSAVITAGRLSPEKRRVLRIFQESGYIMLDYRNMVVHHYHKDAAGGIVRDTVTTEYKEPLKEELRDFLSSVTHRRRPRVNGEDGREALKVALEINRKIKETL
ncbi:inositol 2-dehydrogenase/D-chiro-inositol 3-dehydrogenase [bacterium BMS3Bbin06]|nr:inositol 2-dehydrogenase/D-chiro-inositol 3-dehydrogenase [bacterium BMS3Abin08]GBE33653.1 inositol 2-dehydrogenase/D-chiro-inositol 3-dehydrogenase [bacterium BMS3Bbin06]HDO36527.1 Gfo/Idh/MocA family oxidoreductase [Nitrospirota bacterium]HDY72054.1 Gfo/Idh/MocA family oxidoreductase [Nitrospirota bacterium]